jgi:hypothetical protein
MRYLIIAFLVLAAAYADIPNSDPCRAYHQYTLND